MAHLLVRHRVSDFEAWKAVFDSHRAAQEEAGLRITHVLRNVDEPNEVILLFLAEDVQRARGFVYAPQGPTTQQEAGVVDNPDIFFLT